MGRYQPSGQSLPAPHKRGVHPVMRGIGCIMIVVVPILAYGVAVLLVNFGIRQGWPIPPNWLGTPTFHPLLWRLEGVAVILNFLSKQAHLTANIIFAIAITIVLGGIMSMVYGYIYALFGPPQYGPTDEPPLRMKVKRYKR